MVLDHAARLFRLHGYGAISMHDSAAACGIEAPLEQRIRATVGAHLHALLELDGCTGANIRNLRPRPWAGADGGPGEPPAA